MKNFKEKKKEKCEKILLTIHVIVVCRKKNYKILFKIDWHKS